jgi:hypothetical protein
MFTAYPWAEMVYCCHCGKLAEGGRFCAACGKPIAPEAIEAMNLELRRHRKQMRLMVAALGLVLVAVAGLILSRANERGRSPMSGESSAPALRQQQIPPPPTAPAPPGQPSTPEPVASQPQQPSSQVIVSPGTSDAASRPFAAGIDAKAVQSALATLAPQSKPKDPSPQPETASASVSTGSDRYPGSQPVEVKDANLPDIGIPVAGEVYSTRDSVSTVVSYYTQRYPDAEVMEISGQKVIAVSRPGTTKVIAIGASGEDTRIAIVQPRN